MKPKSTARLSYSFAAAIAALFVSSAVHAATLTWDATAGGAINDGAGAWLGAGLWNDTGTPSATWTSGAAAIFGNGGVGGAVTLASPTMVDSLTFNSYITTGYTLGTAGQTITLNTGITKNAGGVAATIASPITLGGIQTWTNNSAANLTVSGGLNNGGNTLTIDGTGTTVMNATANVISGIGGLTKTGAGLLILGGGGTNPVHLYSGTTTINGGTLMVYNIGTTGVPSGNLTISGGVLQDYFGNGGNFSRAIGIGAGQVQITGGVSGFSGQGATNSNFAITGTWKWDDAGFSPTEFVLQSNFTNADGKSTFTSGIDLNGVNRTIRSNQSASNIAGSGTFSGVISNSSGTAAGLIKVGIGHHILSNAANTYNGPTIINGGTLTANTFAAVNTNSSIGKGSAGAGSAADLVLNGGTLRYAAAANATTNRLFSVGTSGGAIDSSAASSAHTLSFTDSGAMDFNSQLGTRTLTLTGSNTGNNTMALLIGDDGANATSLAKTGAGTWILGNAGNNYTGPTTLGGGSLQGAIPGGIGTAGGTSALIFNGGVFGLAAGDFTRSLNTNTTVTAANFTGAGGWAAYGADRNVNLGGASAQIIWATADTGFNAKTVILGANSATHKVTLQNGLDLGTAVRTVQADDGTATVDGELSGILTGGVGGGLTKTGTGTLSLSNANTYTGVTTVSAGVLLLDNANALPGGIGNAGGTSNLTFNGGVVGLATGDFTRSLNTAATASATTFTGAGGWAAFGADRNVNLGGALAPITWATASTGFNNQTLILGASSATHTVTLQNPLIVTTARTVQVDDGSAATDAFLSGAISGTGGNITKTGNGTLNISGNMSNTGGVTLTAGSLVLSGTNTYSGASTVSINNLTLTFQNAGQSVSPNTTLNPTINNNPTATIKLLSDTGGSTGTLTLGNTLKSAGGGTSGTGTMAIFVGNNGAANGGNGAGGVTGSTIVLGTLDLKSNQEGGLVDPRMATKLGVTGADGYKLKIGDVILQARGTTSSIGGFFNPTTAPLTITGTVKQNNGRTAADNAALQTLTLDGTATGNEISGVIKNAADFDAASNVNALATSLVKSNTSTWTLSNANTYSGSTTVSGGTLVGIGANAFGSTSGISIAGAGTLSLRGDSNTSFVKASDSSPYTVSNSASGATINVDRVTGTGAATMSVGNLTTTSTAASWGLNFTGANGVSLSAGTLNTPVSTAGSQVHTITNNIAGGGSLTLASVFNQATTVASPDLAFAGTGNTTVTGAITQTLADMELKKSGAGTLLLNGTTTYTGTTTISGGTLTLGVDDCLSNSSNVVIGNGTLSAAANVNDTAGTLDVTNAASTINLGTGATLAFASGTATWAGTLNITGNFVSGVSLNFGSPTGLTAAQLLAITATGFTDFALDGSGNLTATAGGDPYAAWSGGAAFDADDNNDGVDNGLAWLLGEGDKNANALDSLPVVTQNGGNLVLNFTCLKVAGRGTAVLKLQYSKDLGLSDPWTSHEVVVPDTAGPVGSVTFTIPSVNADPDLVNLQATIPASAASPGTTLFGRLQAVQP